MHVLQIELCKMASLGTGSIVLCKNFKAQNYILKKC